MRIAEIFRSLQGEGRLAGAECIFIRTSGCNLRCRFCDTPYASWVPEGEDLSIDEVLAHVERRDRAASVATFSLPAALAARLRAAQPQAGSHQNGIVPYVVVTGGEPMLAGEVGRLCDELRRQGRHITIETSGTVYLPVACDLMSISPKLSNSTPSPESDPRWTWRHESTRHAPEVIRRLVAEYDCQIKFVVDQPADLDEIDRYLAVLAEIERSCVLLMPQGTDPDDLAEKAQWIEPACRQRGYEFCPRWQVAWFNAARGK